MDKQKKRRGNECTHGTYLRIIVYFASSRDHQARVNDNQDLQSEPRGMQSRNIDVTLACEELNRKTFSSLGDFTFRLRKMHAPREVSNPVHRTAAARMRSRYAENVEPRGHSVAARHCQPVFGNAV